MESAAKYIFEKKNKQEISCRIIITNYNTNKSQIKLACLKMIDSYEIQLCVLRKTVSIMQLDFKFQL